MKKKGMETEYLGWGLIILAALIILVLGAVFLREKGISIIDKIQDLWRFR